MLIHSPAVLARYYRDQRKQRAVTQVDVAEDVAIRQDTVSKFELKPDNVRLDTLFRLLAALDLEMHIVPRGGTTPAHGDKTNSENKGWTEQW